MTAATVGYLNFGFQTYGGSPQTYHTLEEVTDVTGVGTNAPLIDVTNYDTTPGFKEFVAGLADGEEFTVVCNLTRGTYQALLKTYSDAKRILNCKLTFNAYSPNITASFAAATAGYTYGPSLTAANTITFKFKMNGAIS